MIWSVINLFIAILNGLLKTRLVAGPLGCRSNPVRCDWATGETEYLNRLTSIDGRPVLYRRVGGVTSHASRQYSGQVCVWFQGERPGRAHLHGHVFQRLS